MLRFLDFGRSVRLRACPSTSEHGENKIVPSEEAINKGLGLIAILPQEDAYNAAALNASSHAFGRAAAVGTVQVRYSQRNSGKTFYLHRDIDMIVFQRCVPTMQTRSSSDGCFGRFSDSQPSPSRTEVYLPSSRCPQKMCKTPLILIFPFSPDAAVRTYWKAYHKSTGTADAPVEAVPLKS